MFKKLFLSTFIVTLVFTISANNNDMIATIPNISACGTADMYHYTKAQHKLAHIEQEIKSLFLELQKTLLAVNRTSVDMKKNKLKNDYEHYDSIFVYTINTIMNSKAFKYTANAYTHAALSWIIDQEMTYETFTFNFENYPFSKDTINEELAATYKKYSDTVTFNENTNQFFNALWVFHSKVYIISFLLEKLETQKKELIIELHYLQKKMNKCINPSFCHC